MLISRNGRKSNHSNSSHSKSSVEHERGRFENVLNENVDTEVEDAFWQWEMDHSGAPSTPLETKTSVDHPPSVSPRAENASEQQPQEDWREEWLDEYAKGKEGSFKASLDSPNSPGEQSAAQLEDDAIQGWATLDVREVVESDPDPDPISPLSGSLELEYEAPDAEYANDTSNLEEDQNMQEELATRHIQTAFRGFLVQNEAKTKTKTRPPMNEELAALRIQTVYRGFMARRAFRPRKGMARLQALVKGNTVKRQAAIALRCIQALVKVQVHSRAKHVRSTLQNQSVQKKLIQQLEVEAPAKKPELVQNTQNGWCDKVGSAAEIRARSQKRQEAAAKREKARAYALARQWQAGIRHQPQQQQRRRQPPQQKEEATPAGFPTVKSEWGWNWSERWMTVRPWETSFSDDAGVRDGTKSPTKVQVALVDVPSSTERKPLSSTGNGKPIPRFNTATEKGPSSKKVAAALVTPTPVSSRNPKTPIKNSATSRSAVGSRSFSTPKERSNLSDIQDRKRLSLPGTVHGAKLVAQTAVSSRPRTQKPRGSRSKQNGNDVRPSKLSR
ncbi:protein IQ-DOMAIN 5-like isoform X2 [Salvia hispanica]|uniref:protein IQ-DOMAIN 5-like isoform X2 n=1 Tax=Salvia hispanica TaxID=49212 RepID=UPI002009D662|nr:protein IQ-DOMAIN 5-like isoform X2 [Salvia hispanica]